MPTLVFVEARGEIPTPDSLAALRLATAVDDDVRAAVFSACPDPAAEEAAGHGASTVYAVCDPSLADPLPEPCARILQRLVAAEKIETVLLPTSVLAADVAGRLSASLEAGLNWDLAGLRRAGGELVGERLAFDDSLVVEVGWDGTPRIALMRPGAVPAERGARRGRIVPVEVNPSELDTDVTVVSREPAGGDDARLEAAEVIVAGGKGLGSKANFGLVEELAAELGGLVAATRAVVELGWYPQSAQVGQTGRTVAPRLYVACGISGAIHHKVGMHRSEVIVAINTDRSAPIFDYCDLGIVGDVTAVLPQLTAALRKRRGQQAS